MREKEKILPDLDNADSYIDNPIIYTDKWKALLQVLEELVWRLQQADLPVARPR